VAGEFGANHRGELGRRRGVCGREHGFESKEKMTLPLSTPCFGSGGALQLVVGGCAYPMGAAVTAATPSLKMADPICLLPKLCFAKKPFSQGISESLPNLPLWGGGTRHDGSRAQDHRVEESQERRGCVCSCLQALQLLVCVQHVSYGCGDGATKLGRVKRYFKEIRQRVKRLRCIA